MPIFVWAALALAALLISGTAASNIGAGHAVVVTPASMSSIGGQSLLPWYAWLALGAIGVLSLWLGRGILWGRR